MRSSTVSQQQLDGGGAGGARRSELGRSRRIGASQIHAADEYADARASLCAYQTWPRCGIVCPRCAISNASTVAADGGGGEPTEQQAANMVRMHQSSPVGGIGAGGAGGGGGGAGGGGGGGDNRGFYESTPQKQTAGGIRCAGNGARFSLVAQPDPPSVYSCVCPEPVLAVCRFPFFCRLRKLN
jgi:hypothetical protein